MKLCCEKCHKEKEYSEMVDITISQTKAVDESYSEKVYSLCDRCAKDILSGVSEMMHGASTPYYMPKERDSNAWECMGS